MTAPTSATATAKPCQPGQWLVVKYDAAAACSWRQSGVRGVASMPRPRSSSRLGAVLVARATLAGEVTVPRSAAVTARHPR
jgi:hypothetical protein